MKTIKNLISLFRPHALSPTRVALLSLLALGRLMAPAAAQTPGGTGAFQPRQVADTDLKARADWRNVGRTTPETCFETSCWAHATGNIDVILTTLAIEDAARTAAQEALQGLPADERAKFGSADRLIAILLTRRTPLSAIAILGVTPSAKRPDEVGLHWLNRYDDGRIRENKNVVLRLTPDGWRQVISARYLEPLLKTRLRDDRPGPVAMQGIFPKKMPGSASAPLMPDLVPVAALQNRGMATPIAAFETLQWAKARGDLATLEKLIVVKPDAREKASAKLAGLSADGRAKMPDVTTPERAVISQWAGSSREVGLQVDTETVLSPDRVYFSGRRQNELGPSNFDWVLRRTVGGWKWFMSDFGAPFASTNAPAGR